MTDIYIHEAEDGTVTLSTLPITTGGPVPLLTVEQIDRAIEWEQYEIASLQYRYERLFPTDEHSEIWARIHMHEARIAALLKAREAASRRALGVLWPLAEFYREMTT